MASATEKILPYGPSTADTANFGGVDPATGLPWGQTAASMAQQQAPAPANPFDPAAGTAPLTGFASRYSPAMADQAYENPWYLLRDIFPGMTESNPFFQAMRDLGGDPLTLYNIIMGSQNKLDQGAGSFINWAADMYGEQGKRGGRDFDAGELIGMLFGQDKFGLDSENTLGQILGAGDMSTQVRTLFNMLRDVSNVSMNPLAARGYQSAVAQAGDRYGNAMMNSEATDAGTAPMNVTSWIAENAPWLAGR